MSYLVAAIAFIMPAMVSVPSDAQTPAGMEAPGVERLQVQTKRRIAVMDFDFASTGLTASAFSFTQGAGPSKGISNLITNRLAKTNSFILVERSRIDAILQEQGLAQSGMLEPATAAQIGRLLGADVVLIGSVTRFNLDKKSSRGSGYVPFFGSVGGGEKKVKAVVQISARLVSSTTGEILTAVEGNGEADAKDGGFRVRGFSGGSDSESTDELLSNAADLAVTQVVTELMSASSKIAALPAVLPNINALIADVAGNQVIINKGAKDGFRAGMTLSVERVVKQIKDPATGKPLRTVSSPIGQVQITEIDAESAVARILSGRGFQVGDIVKAVE